MPLSGTTGLDYPKAQYLGPQLLMLYINDVAKVIQQMT